LRQNKVGIVIADDHPVFRHGLRQIVDAEPGFTVLGEAGDGESALKMIKNLRPAIAVIAGIKGYVLKDSAATDIISCIKAVAEGKNYTSPEFTTYLVSRVRQAESASSSSGLEDLTVTERRVLSLIAEYKTSKEIAQKLFISPRTVETHRNNICQKLGVHGSHALMKFALAHKDKLSC
jgi:DNA-binding NarL/FixJ family response regulator